MATELASLVDAELIRMLDLVIIEKGPDDTYEVREFEDLAARDRLGDLRAVEGQLAEVLAREDLDNVVRVLEAGTTAAVVVYENTWAAPLALAAADAADNWSQAAASRRRISSTCSIRHESTGLT